MEFLKKFDLTGTQFIKLIVLLGIALVALSILSSLFSSSTGLSTGLMNSKISVSTPAYYDSMEQDASYGVSELSMRNVGVDIAPVPGGGYTPGADSEAFEVKEYSATIETRQLEQDCKAIQSLKSRPDVIFENSNEYERGCNYTFKVEKDSVESVLAIISALNPKDLNENSYTIKREVTDYTSEIQILENKLATLDKTLAEALASYESISTLATRVGDVESLAKIIDSKLNLIERLTNTRIETSSQLERINRAKSEALDRLAYTYFHVNVYENKFVDGEEIKDSWKLAVKQFVRETNNLVQDLSIGFVTLLLTLVKFALYGIVLLFVARFGYTFARKVWKSGNTN